MVQLQPASCHSCSLGPAGVGAVRHGSELHEEPDAVLLLSWPWCLRWALLCRSTSTIVNNFVPRIVLWKWLHKGELILLRLIGMALLCPRCVCQQGFCLQKPPSACRNVPEALVGSAAC